MTGQDETGQPDEAAQPSPRFVASAQWDGGERPSSDGSAILCRHCGRPILRTQGSHGWWYHADGEIACEPDRKATESESASPSSDHWE